MSKQKSVFVTAIMAVMLAIITFSAYRLSMPVFIILVSILSSVGFASSAIMFCRWLEKEPVKAPEVMEPPIPSKSVNLDSEEFATTYEQIRQEFEAGNE